MPPLTYVSELTASRHEPSTVFAAFDNHKNGDFKPYVLQQRTIAAAPGRRSPATCPSAAPSTRSSRTTCGPSCSSSGRSSASSSPSTADAAGCGSRAASRPSSSGTSTSSGGRTTWCVGTFGRGFYVLDDYSPLRHVDRRTARAGGDPLPGQGRLAVQREHAAGAGAGKASQGDDFYYGREPALRRRLHLLPEGRAEDAREGPPRGGEEGPRGQGSGSTTRAGTSCARRTARRNR